MKNLEVIEEAKAYLLSQIVGGLCLEFSQLRHGPSIAWTTACVGSTLAEFSAVPQKMIEVLLSLQWDNGGWSYNQKVMPDADSTLRVLQFLNKIGFKDKTITEKAEKFVTAHQQSDGGISTYLPDSVKDMGYPEGGWTAPHPCVTALAVNILTNRYAREKASQYMALRLVRGDARAYWWKTPWYVRYLSGYINGESANDPVEIGLALLLRARFGVFDSKLLIKLIEMQLDDGSFPESHQFRIPRPNQFLEDVDDQVELIADQKRIFSTAAAVVAIHRQEALL